MSNGVKTMPIFEGNAIVGHVCICTKCGVWWNGKNTSAHEHRGAKAPRWEAFR